MQTDDKLLMSFKDPIDKKHNPGNRVEKNKDTKKSSNLPGGSPDEEDRPHNELKTSENEARES